MPRKKFEEEPYDPFQAEVVRAATSAGTAVGEEQAPAIAKIAAPTPSQGKQAEKVINIPRPKPAPTPSASKQAEPETPPETAPLTSGPAKRFKVTFEEEAEYEAFLVRLREAAHTRPDFSVLCRALWTLARNAEPQLVEALKRHPIPKRPSKNDSLAMANYEAAWVAALAMALRNAPAPR